MVQFNLLPDVKLEYIKARRTKHLVMLGSLIAASIAVGVTVVLFIGVNVVQKRHLNNLNTDIQKMSKQLEGEKDIDKILTVQNQLNSLNGLHETKPAIDRLGEYLARITPNDVSIASLSVDLANSTMEFSGSASAIKNVNEFIDTMKFTTHQVEGDTKNTFSNVVLTSFSRGTGDADGAASYAITLNYDPVIFDIKERVTLKVPNQITTRSVTERPSPLFQPAPENSEGEGQ